MVDMAMHGSADRTRPASMRALLRNSVWRSATGGRFLRSEEGSVTSFSLFIFLMMLFVGGMAVDLMRFETNRAALQNTLDASALAATNLRSDADAEALVKSIMAKRGYDPNITTVNVEETFTGADPVTGNPGTLVARSVQANYDLDVNTIFMPLLGIESLGTAATGGAKEGLQTVEISLVVDISGSMAGDKISDLKVAAKNFVNQVIDPLRADLPVTVSIIPFNHTVVVPDALLNRLNTSATVPIPAALQAPYPGALTAYPRTAANSKCVRFMDSEMITSDLETQLDPDQNPNYLLLRAITETQTLDRMAYYDPDTKSYGSGDSYARPGDDYNRRCDPTRSAILPYATDIATIEAYIGDDTTGLQAGGNTSNDTGLKWGVALLDPAFRAIVSDMVSDNELPAAVDGRPYDYNPTSFLKIVVLMTDGANTTQYDLDSDKKSGPSRVWFSCMASKNQCDTDGDGDLDDVTNQYIVDSNQNGYKDREKEWYDGYFVEMPTYSSGSRFMRQHKPWDDDDAVLYGESELPPDAVQLDYTQLYDRFSERVVAYLFRDDDVGVYNDYYQHYYAEDGVQSGSDADRRMSGSPTNATDEFGICDAAKVGNDILVYTIAFQAGGHAEDVMQDCATNSGYYFKADDDQELYDAFEKIAGAITTLRLTQ